MTNPGASSSRRVDGALAAFCALVFTFWQFIGTRHFSIKFLALSLTINVVALIAGDLVERFVRNDFDFPLRFLTGYLALNSVLYILIWILPFGIVVDFVLVAALLIALYFLVAPRQGPSRVHSFGSSTLCVCISLVGATLWSQDVLTPIVPNGDTVIVKPWGDNPFHMSQIAMFAYSHGARSINEPRMAGAVERPAYHYASYILPALLVAGAKIPAIYACTSYWLPVGIFLTGLGAYALVRWWWGEWPGVAAAALLLLFPDAAFQGFDNYFLSYHWLMQVTGASGYGIAVVAVAWVFMFEACRQRRFGLMFASWITLAIGLVFKSHMVLPSAALLWLFPVIVMPRISKARRVAWFFCGALIFLLVVALSQKFPGIPVLRLDFSSASDYLASIARQFEHSASPVASYLSSRLTPGAPLSQSLPIGLVVLFCCTLGIAGIAYLVLIFGFARTMPLAQLLFPLLVIAVYLLMSTGLAYDTHAIGQPEELLHRPFPWAYFVVTAWVGGAIYRSMFGNAAPSSFNVRIAFALVLMLAAGAAFFCGKNVQAGPTSRWGMSVTNVPHPAGLIECAEFIRSQSRSMHRRPVMQDSGNDPLLLVTALSEVQQFASDCRITVRAPAGLAERLQDVQNVLAMRDGKAVQTYFASHHITWYLLRSKTQVNWPGNLLKHPAFQSHGYRVYHFS